VKVNVIDEANRGGLRIDVAVSAPAARVMAPLRIAFNATPLLSPLTGIGNYIAHLGAALAVTEQIDAFSFYGRRWRHEAPRPWVAGGPVEERSRARRFRHWVPSPVRTLLRYAWQPLLGGDLRRRRICLYHEPNYVPLSYAVPVVITIHDLSWLRYPKTLPADRVRWLERGVPRAIDRAAAIIVDSEFVRKEVLDTFAVAPERVHAVHLGVSETFYPRGAKDAAPVLSAHGLVHGQYVLALSTIEPRKNLEHVLEAYGRLPEALRARHPLVVGGAKGWRAGRLESTLRDLARRGQIRFLGHVHAAELPIIYAGAAALVFPSRYEGFGLPPLEAMAAGVPVIVANAASLPEVVGDAAIMVDPDRPEETAARIEELFGDARLRARLSAKGRARAAIFTWSSCAAATLAVYRLALARV
jgi:alpha-1,3-rhamnosyl/mannosyltransferase